MIYTPQNKQPHQQADWAQIWLDDITRYRDWVRVDAIPSGYCVYLYLGD